MYSTIRQCISVAIKCVCLKSAQVIAAAENRNFVQERSLSILNCLVAFCKSAGKEIYHNLFINHIKQHSLIEQQTQRRLDLLLQAYQTTL